MNKKLHLPHRPAQGARIRPLAGLLLAALLLSSCAREADDSYQGYVEGEYVRVASALPGTLIALQVEKGDTVAAGAALFELESAHEAAGLARAEQRRRQAVAARREAIDALDRREAVASADSGAVSVEALAQARLQRELAEGDVAAADAELVQARWALEQKVRAAPVAGQVTDTLYEPGEFVAAGKPVVSLLPPGGVTIRFFVPEPQLSGIRIGDAVRVALDGRTGAITATVDFVAAEPEFTPPVIYSRSARAKLVYQVEARPSAEWAVALHPGQPVDVHKLP